MDSISHEIERSQYQNGVHMRHYCLGYMLAVCCWKGWSGFLIQYQCIDSRDLNETKKHFFLPFFQFLVTGIRRDLLIKFIYSSFIIVVLIYHCRLLIWFSITTTVNISTANTLYGGKCKNNPFIVPMNSKKTSCFYWRFQVYQFSMNKFSNLEISRKTSTIQLYHRKMYCPSSYQRQVLTTCRCYQYTTDDFCW